MFARLVSQISGLPFPDKVSPKMIYNRDIDPLLPHVPLTWAFVEMGSFEEKNDEKRDQVFIDSQQVDTGAHLEASLNAPLDPNESLRIRGVKVH